MLCTAVVRTSAMHSHIYTALQTKKDTLAATMRVDDSFVPFVHARNKGAYAYLLLVKNLFLHTRV